MLRAVNGLQLHHAFVEKEKKLVVLLKSAGCAGNEIDEVEELDVRRETLRTLTDVCEVGGP